MEAIQIQVAGLRNPVKTELGSSGDSSVRKLSTLSLTFLVTSCKKVLLISFLHQKMATLYYIS